METLKPEDLLGHKAEQTMAGKTQDELKDSQAFSLMTAEDKEEVLNTYKEKKQEWYET